MSNGKLYEDMCQMNILNQPQVLRNLIERYKNDDIFTYIGPTLIVVNPYKIIQKHFNKQILQKQRQNIISGVLKGSPHIYMIAGKAYNGLKSNQGKQAIIISGQSGAGKTQSTKYCMKMITSLSHKQTKHSIEDKILACNPLLQAFGNSKTIRNDNSSRFGKYVQIFFGSDYTIKGANIISYLLQKSRVVSVTPGQRTYHAFYALTASKQFGAKQPQKYNYLKQSECYSANNINDKQYFKQINKSMDQIGFSSDQQKKIWKLVLCILELGNLEFNDSKHHQNQSLPCQIINKGDINNISKVLDITSQALQKLLVFQKKIMLKQVSFKAYGKQACLANRNTLCKAIYNSIFQFIIYKIQIALDAHAHHSNNSINLLDIFGFQNFIDNSLEQLCINFTNQKLLKTYNKYVFQNQMVILKQDGLQKAIQAIKPPTNDDIISLLSDKLSLFSIINDNTPNIQFKDSDMINGFQRDFGKHKNIKFDMFKKQFFTIKHSQCEVMYNINGFKHKNQDKVSTQIEQIYSKLFVNQNKDQVGKTLLSKFTREIQDLVKQLASASNHFVRCIKPNQQKLPKKVNQNYLLTQVRYLGVFQTIQIRQKTFPARKIYQQFISTYQQIYNNAKGKQGKQAVKAILKQNNAVQSKQYLLGKSRIYMNKQLQQKLNKALYMYYKIKNQKAIKIQKAYRKWIFKKKIFMNLKLLVNRKKIWIKYAQQQKIKILKNGFNNIKNYNEYIKKQQQKQQLMKKFIQEKKRNEQQMNKKNQLKNIEISKITNNKIPEQAPKVQQKQNILLKDLFKKNKNENLDQTIIAEPDQKPYVLQRPEIKQEPMQGKFNQSFVEGQSIYISSKPDVIFQKMIPVSQYDPKYSTGNIQKLQKIIAQQYKLQIGTNQQQYFSPGSNDCSFQIDQIPFQMQQKIISFPAEQFFKKVLRKRTTFLGMAKDYQDVLVAKNAPMTKTLTILNPIDQQKALKVFKVIVRVGQQVKLDNVFRLIENMINLCQSTTQQLKNQIFIQLIKQCNTSHQLAAVRIYQSLAVFLHIYLPDQQFLNAGLYLFYKKIQSNKNSTKQQQYLRYLFKKMLRKIQNPPVINYMPIKYQMMALMCRRQVSIPVYLPVGNSVLIKVQSYHTFFDIKQRVIKELGIDSERLTPQMFKFFQIVNFQNQQLQENPINQNQIVWDIMTYWQLAKQKYKQAQSSPPAFFLMIKLAYAFQLYADDIQGIQLCFAQCYFDYFIGRIKLDFKQMAGLAACVKLIKLSHRPQNETIGAYPIWMSRKYDKQQLTAAMIQNVKQIQQDKLQLIEIKYRFLQICDQCPLAMSMAIPTEQSTKLFLKPKKIYLTDKGIVKQEFSMKSIVKWALDKQKFVFDIKSNKSHVILTQHAYVCSQYLSQLPKLYSKKAK